MLVLGVGIGVILLVVVWTTIATVVLFCGHRKLIPLLTASVLSAVFSILLLLFPQHRGPTQPPPEDKVSNLKLILYSDVIFMKSFKL